jgi:hypothetical protein
MMPRRIAMSRCDKRGHTPSSIHIGLCNVCGKNIKPRPDTEDGSTYTQEEAHFWHGKADQYYTEAYEAKEALTKAEKECKRLLEIVARHDVE